MLTIKIILTILVVAACLILLRYYTTPLEVGVVLLPDAETAKEAQVLREKSLRILTSNDTTHPTPSFNGFPNHFHLTLFQLRIKRFSYNQLKNVVNQLCSNLNGMSFIMNDVLSTGENSVSWESTAAQLLPELRALHAQTLEAVSPLRDHSTPFSQLNSININLLSAKQQQDIKQYGIYWSLPTNFSPHITLIYEAGTNQVDARTSSLINGIKPTQPMLFNTQAIAIGQLGPVGNVTKILYQCPRG